MGEPDNTFDVLIIGGGPNGLACAIEAQAKGLSYLVLEKGGITDSIRRFPTNMTFFSTPELLELGGLPFSCAHLRPSRQEALEYYRRVVDYFSLNLQLHSKVISIRAGAGFELRTCAGRTLRSRFLIAATGYFDLPNELGIPGEDLPHVSHYYDEPYRYSNSSVVVVGGENSAVEAALDLYRHGAAVTLLHRGPTLGHSIKYWVRPDIDNRIGKGAINALFGAVVTEIAPGWVQVERLAAGTQERLNAQFVFLLTGYRPDADLLGSFGVRVDKHTLIPQHDSETFETNIENAYIAGSVACGCETGNIFIENGRLHARSIVADIMAKRG